MKPFDLSVQFFFQLAFILAACRLVGLLARRLGQPQVVGEMIAGVLMGPSLFGYFFPHAQTAIFPPESRAILFSVSQIGLSLYMFLVGVEFDHELIRKRIRSAASVSIAGIAAPFALGAAVAWLFAGKYPLFSAATTPLQAMLFMGAAMSITAFPMLARIILEQGLAGTSLGTLALAAGSLDDAGAWCVLAVVLATFSNHASIAVFAIGGGVLYALAMLVVVRPLLRPLGRDAERHQRLSAGALTGTLCLVMLGSWFTDRIGIYAVFGAFIAGLAMPRGLFARELRRQVEPLVTCLLLPLFFIYSGLNTRITLLSDSGLWGLTLLILLLAITGKGVACAAAARLNGEPLREAMGIGALMNARGLMELIILNIGLERGVITPTLFAIMILMALVTTLMASPLFELVYRRGQSSIAARGAMTPGRPAVNSER